MQCTLLLIKQTFEKNKSAWQRPKVGRSFGIELPLGAHVITTKTTRHVFLVKYFVEKGKRLQCVFSNFYIGVSQRGYGQLKLVGTKIQKISFPK